MPAGNKGLYRWTFFGNNYYKLFETLTVYLLLLWFLDCRNYSFRSQ